MPDRVGGFQIYSRVVPACYRLHEMCLLRWLTLALVLVAGLSGAARADSRDKARESFRKATKLYDFGEYAKALQAFKDVYEQVEDPALLYNIAQCHRRLGNTREAIDVYQSYLRRAENPPNRAEVRAMIAKLQKTLPPEPPTKLQEPVPLVAPPPPPVVVVVAPPPAKKPLHQRWQFWVPLVAGIVVVGGAVGLGVALTTPQNASYSPATLRVQFP